MRPPLHCFFFGVFDSGRPIGAVPSMDLRDYIGLVGFFILMFALPASLTAENTLSEKSPFLPPRFGQEAPKSPSPPPPSQGPISRELELRGIIQIGGIFQFSLFSKKENKAYWIKEGETVSEISVQDFEDANGTVVVSKNGRSEQLTLVSSTDNPIPVAISVAPTNQPKATPTNRPSQINEPGGNNRRVVPRRRVVLPKSN